MGNAGDTHCHQCGQGGVSGTFSAIAIPRGWFIFYTELHDCALLAVYYDLRTYASTTVQEKNCLKIPLEHPIPMGTVIVARCPDILHQDKLIEQAPLSR